MRVPSRLHFPSVDGAGDAARHAAYLATVASVIEGPRADALDVLDLKPGDALLDAGCGAGEHAVEISSRVSPGGRVVGIDASAELIGRARESAARVGSPVEFLVGDIRAMPFADASFDAVRCERVLQHLARAGATRAVAEMLRVTRPGGRLQLLDLDHYQTAFTATDAELARRLVVESRAKALFPDAGLFLTTLLHEVGGEDITVFARVGCFNDLVVFDVLQQLGVSLDEMVSAGAVETGRAAALQEELAARNARGEFLGTLVIYIATARKGEQAAGSVDAR